MPENIAGWRP